MAGCVRELETLRRFRPKGFADLQKLAPGYGITELSPIEIAAMVLGGRISKAQRLSNREAVTLTEAQKRYTATDARLCTEVYRRLMEN